MYPRQWADRQNQVNFAQRVCVGGVEVGISARVLSLVQGSAGCCLKTLLFEVLVKTLVTPPIQNHTDGMYNS